MWSGGSGIAVCSNEPAGPFACARRIFFAVILLFAVILQSSPADADDRLYYFGSFSVPEESLKKTIADGEKIGLKVVLRGFPEGSMKKALLRVQKLLDGRKTEILIDPVLFKLYNVTTVPTVIYAAGINPSCEHCEPVPRHWKAVGDISLEAALNDISRSVPAVDGYLKKLREGFYSH